VEPSHRLKVHCTIVAALIGLARQVKAKLRARADVNGMLFRKLRSCHSLTQNNRDKKTFRAAPVRERFHRGGQSWPN
jgi:hypothetical protein